MPGRLTELEAAHCASQTAGLLARSLAELEPEQIVLLYLRYERGQTFERIGRAMKITTSAAWRLHQRTLGELRALLARSGVRSLWEVL